MMKIAYKNDMKFFASDEYNYSFNVKNGNFIRFGKTIDDDPQWSPFGPELLDVEISTKCSRGCNFCYKSNTKDGENMTLEKFSMILKKIPQTLCQIALGIGDIDGNPDLFKILRECRRHLVVPNITINGSGLDVMSANKLATICGAIAVSHYGNECFDAIAILKQEGAQQVNIHQLLSEETKEECWALIDDERIKDVNAIVFLSGKPKGRGMNVKPVSREDYKAFVNTLLAKKIRFGFDSCGADKFLDVVKGHPSEKYFKTVVEPCESTLFSLYINVKGIAYPCSFLEGEWDGTQVLGVKDYYNDNWKVRGHEVDEFIKDVWNSEPIARFRKTILAHGRTCPVYKI